jgi:excisionase family DNA binding protein
MSATRAAPERATYTVAEAAALLGLSKNGAYAAAAKGNLPVIRIGGKILVSKPALDRMLAGR